MDNYISEIIVVVDAERCQNLNGVAVKLKAGGMNVLEVNENEGIIEGTVSTSLLKQIVFTYNARGEDEPTKRAG